MAHPEEWPMMMQGNAPAPCLQRRCRQSCGKCCTDGGTEQNAPAIAFIRLFGIATMSAAIDLVSFVSRRPLPVTNRRKVIVAANHIRDRLNVRCWNQADLAAWLPDVRFQWQEQKSYARAELFRL